MHTNHTTNYELSQFVGTDKPTFLGDYNGDMLKIDTAIAGVSATATGADAKADSAIASATSAASTASDAATLANTANTNASSALTTAGNAATAASAAQSTAEAAGTAANAADTKATAANTAIGDLTNLTTTDKTSLVSAINEVNAKPTGGGTAADITYDNTDSGLIATDVQAAIDEIASAMPAQPVEVTGDGVKTIGALLDELWALIDLTKITAHSVIEVSLARESDVLVAPLIRKDLTDATYKALIFSMGYTGDSDYVFFSFTVKPTGSKALQNTSATISNFTTTVYTNGWKIKVFY